MDKRTVMMRLLQEFEDEAISIEKSRMVKVKNASQKKDADITYEFFRLNMETEQRLGEIRKRFVERIDNLYKKGEE